MPTQDEILTGVQFPLGGLSGPINTDTDPPYELSYQFAGSSQPGDLTSISFDGWTPMTPGEEAAMRAGLDHIETFLNVRFVEVTGAADPDLNFGKVDVPGTFTGYGGFNYRYRFDGTLTEFDGYAVFENTVSIASGRDALILHELGHALTLKHPFEDVTQNGLNHPRLDPDFDSEKYTLMSYDDNPEIAAREDTMMLYDVFALQDLWGANLETATGDDTYTGPRNAAVDVIWDAGGEDTFDASANVGSAVIDLREGTFSAFAGVENIAIAYGVVIENAFGGSGNDFLTGNTAANLLRGGAGDDQILGLGGDDRIEGGDGTDTLNGGGGDDVIVGGETAADRRDTIFAGIGNDMIDAGYGNDLVYGQDGNDTIAGGFGADELFGQNGNDVITGSAFSDLVFGGAGDDFVNGGFGFDRINGGAGADRFFHAGAEGHGSDWIQDFTAADGDILVFGNADARVSDFVVRFAHTATPEGERSGDDDVQEAFVNYRGQTLWALVDGGDEAVINLRIGSEVFDLLA